MDKTSFHSFVFHLFNKAEDDMKKVILEQLLSMLYSEIDAKQEIKEELYNHLLKENKQLRTRLAELENKSLNNGL